MHGIAAISGADAHQGFCAPKAITAATRITSHPLNLSIVENGKGLKTISSKDGLERVVLQKDRSSKGGLGYRWTHRAETECRYKLNT